MLNCLNEYFKWIWKSKMAKLVIGIFVYVLIPFTLLQIYSHNKIAVGWFLFSMITSLSFGYFYLDYKKLDK